MSTRDVRDLITAAWATKLRTEGAKNPHALANELAVIAEAHGVKLARPAHLHDPAADWRAPVDPGDTAAGIAAARSALGLPAATDETNGAAQ